VRTHAEPAGARAACDIDDADESRSRCDRPLTAALFSAEASSQPASSRRGRTAIVRAPCRPFVRLSSMNRVPTRRARIQGTIASGCNISVPLWRLRRTVQPNRRGGGHSR
jgi:hypothetical protein